MNFKSTKFWVTVGVEVMLFAIFLLLLFKGVLDRFFTEWILAFVGVPIQYGVLNVVASGQAAGSNAPPVAPPTP